MVQISPPPPPARGSSTSWLYVFRVFLFLICKIVTAVALGIMVYDVIVYYRRPNISVNIIGISSGGLTLMLIPAMLLIGRRREDLWFAYILTEIILFGLLGSLWIVNDVIIAEDFNFIICRHNRMYSISASEEFCTHLLYKRGLSVAITVLLLFYVLILVIYGTVRAYTVGSSVWLQTMKEQRYSSGSAAPTTETTAAGLPSMWDEKTTDEVHAEVAAVSISGAVPGHTLQAPPGTPSFGVTTYPPSTLSQAVAMQMAAANSVPPMGPAQPYYSPAPQQVNMHVISRSSPQQRAAGMQDTMGYQGAPETPTVPSDVNGLHDALDFAKTAKV